MFHSFLVIQSTAAIHKPDPPPCFLSHAHNITATALMPVIPSDTNHKVKLHWEATTKKSPDLSYCLGARRWQVRALAFSSVEDAPGDYHIADDSSVSWAIVPKRDTNYTFTDIVPNMYYSFQVGHNEKKFDGKDDDDTMPLVFASQVYFFGEQRNLKCS